MGCGRGRRLLSSVLVAGVVALTGEDGLLTSMVQEVLQTGLDVEMADHLGYEPYESIGRGSGSSRNGAYPKMVRTATLGTSIPSDKHPARLEYACALL